MNLEIKKEVLEDYYGEEVLDFYHFEGEFISVVLKDRADILPYISYMRHYKLKYLLD